MIISKILYVNGFSLIRTVVTDLNDAGNTYTAFKQEFVDDVLDAYDGITALTWGDPHLTTFDGFRYDFQSPGEFTLVASKTDDYQVQVRQELMAGSSSVSYTTGWLVS